MSRKTRANTKKNSKEPDINDKFDKMFAAMDSLQSQFADVQARLTTIEDSKAEAVDGSEIETDTELLDKDMGNALRDLVQQRLNKINKKRDSSSSSSEDEGEVSFKPQDANLSKAEKRNLKKSGKLRTAQSKVLKVVDWPHLHVYRRDGRGAEYDTLSQMKFVNGYLQVMKLEKDSTIKSLMYEHLTNLTADASEYPWHAVRNYHSVVLSMMECKRIDWHHTAKIQDLRRQYVWSNAMRSSNGQQVSTTGVKPCPEFQSGKCQKTQPHGGLQHVCAFCLKSSNAIFKHPEYLCRKKSYTQRNQANGPDQSQAKNANGGELP